jgi:hypothetical protein
MFELWERLFNLCEGYIGHVQNLHRGRLIQNHAFLREMSALSFPIYNKFEALIRVYASGTPANRQLLFKFDLTRRRILLILLLLLKLLLVLGKENTGGETILETCRLLLCE